MTCDGTASCPCEDCRATRRAHWKANPLIKPRQKEALWGTIPQHMALAYRLEERDILEAQLALNAAEIKILRDCAGETA